MFASTLPYLALTAALVVGGVAQAGPSSSLSPSSSVAAPDGAHSAQAEALFVLGKQLLVLGSITEACEAFALSHRLEPRVTTLVNHAACRQKQGQLATALKLFTDATALLVTTRDDSEVALRELATQRARELSSRVSRVTIFGAAGPPGFELLLDGKPIDPSQPLLLDGGAYSFLARAPSRRPWAAMLTLRGEGDQQTIVIPALEPIVPKRSSPAIVVLPPRPSERSPRPPSRRAAVGHWLAFGGALGIFGGLAALAMHEGDRCESSKPRCLDTKVGGIVALAGGGLLFGGSVYLWLSAPERAAPGGLSGMRAGVGLSRSF